MSNRDVERMRREKAMYIIIKMLEEGWIVEIYRLTPEMGWSVNFRRVNSSYLSGGYGNSQDDLYQAVYTAAVQAYQAGKVGHAASAVKSWEPNKGTNFVFHGEAYHVEHLDAENIRLTKAKE